MADYIDRQKLIDVRALKEWVKNWFTKNRLYHPYAKNNNIPITELYDILELMPSADAVEVVRCKDCLHFKHSDIRPNYCEVWDWQNTDKDYCSFAERRNDEQIR